MASTEKADDSSGSSQKHADENEKHGFHQTETFKLSANSSFDETYIPNDEDKFIDLRLKDYPIPLVAKTGMVLANGLLTILI